MIKTIFQIIGVIKAIIGLGIIIKATELYNEGYVNTGVIKGINIFTTDSPELVTFFVLVMIGVKIVR